MESPFVQQVINLTDISSVTVFKRQYSDLALTFFDSFIRVSIAFISHDILTREYFLSRLLILGIFPFGAGYLDTVYEAVLPVLAYVHGTLQETDVKRFDVLAFDLSGHVLDKALFSLLVLNRDAASALVFSDISDRVHSLLEQFCHLRVYPVDSFPCIFQFHSSPLFDF